MIEATSENRKGCFWLTLNFAKTITACVTFQWKTSSKCHGRNTLDFSEEIIHNAQSNYTLHEHHAVCVSSSMENL